MAGKVIDYLDKYNKLNLYNQHLDNKHARQLTKLEEWLVMEQARTNKYQCNIAGIEF